MVAAAILNPLIFSAFFSEFSSSASYMSAIDPRIPDVAEATPLRSAFCALVFSSASLRSCLRSLIFSRRALVSISTSRSAFSCSKARYASMSPLSMASCMNCSRRPSFFWFAVCSMAYSFAALSWSSSTMMELSSFWWLTALSRALSLFSAFWTAALFSSS